MNAAVFPGKSRGDLNGVGGATEPKDQGVRLRHRIGVCWWLFHIPIAPAAAAVAATN